MSVGGHNFSGATNVPLSPVVIPTGAAGFLLRSGGTSLLLAVPIRPPPASMALASGTLYVATRRETKNGNPG
jgi:hypothetical protein